MRLLCSSILLSMAVGLPAAAQEASAQDASEQARPPGIVVTGRPLDEQVREFVGALTRGSPGGQLSRFEWQVCPVAIGLPDARKVAVANRMREIARAAGIPLGGPGCQPNILVAVTGDKRAFLQALSRSMPSLFKDMPGDRRRRLLAEPRASAWHVAGPPLDADGRPLELVRYRLPPDYTRVSEPVYMDETMRTASRMTLNSRLHFSAAVVVVEAGALDGLTTTQLADYAAMRAFAQADPARLPASPPPTILSVLDVPMGGTVPVTLTEWDLGLLRGLYRSQANIHAAAQQSEIRRQLRDSLTESENGED